MMRLLFETTSGRGCPQRLCFNGGRPSVDIVKPRIRRLRWHYRESFKRPSYSRALQTRNAVSVDVEVSPNKEDCEGAAFDWFKHWWPVQAVHNLPTDRPSRIKLLGRHYIVWKGHSGSWIAMDDECPHRLAPLSEGRIEKDGNLLCSYHAWRFNESGKCVKIPHAEDDKAHHVACNSPRSAVQTYPCKTRGSLLWIWPDKATNAFAESEKTLLSMDDDIADFLERSAAEGVLYMYVRYLPYSFDVLMENICDPSHVPVSHHGLMPPLSRYKAEPIRAKLVRRTSRGQATVALKYKSPLPIVDQAQFELRKPGVIVTTNKRKHEDVPFARSYISATPICVGKSAVFFATLRQAQIVQTKRLNRLQQFFNRIMVLVAHTTLLNPLLDGDSVFLHEQDKKIRKHGATFSAREKYYVPTPADLLVMDFRRWFENEGQNGAAYGSTEAKSTRTELPREKMLDRYMQHTKHCKICRDFLKNMECFIKTLKLVSFGALFIGSVLLNRALNAPGFKLKTVLRNVSLQIVVAVGLLSSLLRAFLEKNVKPRFYFEDWVHAEKD